MSEENRIPNFIRHQLNEIARIKRFKKGKFSIEFEDSVKSARLLNLVIKSIDDNDHELYLVIKVAPLNGSNVASLLLQREILAYQKVIPALLDIQEKRKIDQETKFTNIPRTYFSQNELRIEDIALVMDDLNNLGYKTKTKCDFIHAKLVMKTLGKFHAMSFALENENSEQFVEFKELSNIVENKNNDESLKKLVSFQFDRALATLEPQEDSKVQKILSIRDNLCEFLNFCTDSSKAEPFCVISHGEFWIDNLMFNHGVSMMING